MFRIVLSSFISLSSPPSLARRLLPRNHPPLRVGIVGLVHGHVHGFLGQSHHSPEIEIVGVAEPDELLSQPPPDTASKTRRCSLTSKT